MTSLADDPDDDPAVADGAVCEALTITLRKETHVLAYVPGSSIVETGRLAGLRPPFSCLRGACATCMSRLTRGTVHTYANEVLTPKEVEAGYILTCQAVPTAREVAVVYED